MMSSVRAPRCMHAFTSRSMKTVQRSPSLTGARDASARSENSPLMATPSSSARSSRKLPVPAAHASFMVKSTTTESPRTGSRARRMYLLSCPPISKMVSGCTPSKRSPTNAAPVLCAVISSWIESAPINSPTNSRPLPVVPTPQMRKRCPTAASISRRWRVTTSMGLPAVRVNTWWAISPSASMTTSLVPTDPISRPR
jgi:hypothetical protein